jgi:hypothetical protein
MIHKDKVSEKEKNGDRTCLVDKEKSEVLAINGLALLFFIFISVMTKKNAAHYG